jgi:hypothetical protein
MSFIYQPDVRPTTTIRSRGGGGGDVGKRDQQFAQYTVIWTLLISFSAGFANASANY